MLFVSIVAPFYGLVLLLGGVDVVEIFVGLCIIIFTAVLSAAVALTVGLIGGTAYTIAIGVGAAIASAITWAVIGTIVALLAQIADNKR